MSCVLAAAGLVLGACSDDGDDAAGSTSGRSSGSSSAEPADDDCIERLLEAASLNTDGFPSMVVFPGGGPPDGNGFGEVECAGVSEAANITYLIGEFDAGVAPPPDAAVADDTAIIEPGGDAADRLDDPGTTWSEQEGAADLVAELTGDGAVQYELAAPAPDRSPVTVMSSAADGNGRLWLVWRFADADVAAGSVDALMAALPRGTEAKSTPTVDGTVVRVDVERRVQLGGLVPINPELGLADG